MADRGKDGDVNEAARRFAETLADSYRVVYGQAAGSAERQQRRAREFSELVSSNLREQQEAGRANARQLSEQAGRQREAGQELARESVEAYTRFLDDAFSRYRSGTERATEGAREGARTLAETTTGLLGTATGAVGATAGAAAGGGGGNLPGGRLRRDERRGGLQAPQRPLRGGAPAGARPRGAQQGARDAPRADGPQDKGIPIRK